MKYRLVERHRTFDSLSSATDRFIVSEEKYSSLNQMVCARDQGGLLSMARNLYRCYLYIVQLSLLIFFSSALSGFLYQLFALTPLHRRPSYDIEYRGDDPYTSLAQSAVFLVVSLLIVSLLGGLHYWLMRRDIRQDAEAGSGGIRAFFLNLVELVAIIIAVGLLGYGVLLSWGFTPQYADVSWALAAVIANFFVVGVVEWERRRVAVATVVGRVLQRIHYYGAQTIFLIFFMIAWSISIRELTNNLLQTFGLIESRSDPIQPLGLILGSLWFACWWVLYSLPVRRDVVTPVRLLVQGWTIFWSGVFLLSGSFVLLQLILNPLFGVTSSWKDIVGWGSYEFFSFLSLGLLLFLGGRFVSFNLTTTNRVRTSTFHALNATIFGLISSLFFWYGLAAILFFVLQTMSGDKSSSIFSEGDGGIIPSTYWLAAIAAIIIGGAGYIPFSIYLRRQSSHLQANVGPRRGFVLIILATGLLVGTISAIVLLYTLLNKVVGLPISSEGETLRLSFSAFLVSLIIVGLYIRIAIGEELFRKKKVLSTVPVSVAPTAAIPLEPTMGSPIVTEETSEPITQSETSPTTGSPIVTEETSEPLTQEEISPTTKLHTSDNPAQNESGIDPLEPHSEQHQVIAEIINSLLKDEITREAAIDRLEAIMKSS